MAPQLSLSCKLHKCALLYTLYSQTVFFFAWRICNSTITKDTEPQIAHSTHRTVDKQVAKLQQPATIGSKMMQMNAGYKEVDMHDYNYKAIHVIFIHIPDEYQKLFDKTKVEDSLGNRICGIQQMHYLTTHIVQKNNMIGRIKIKQSHTCIAYK